MLHSVHRITSLRSLLRFKGVLDIYQLEYPNFFPPSQSFLKFISEEEKDNLFDYVLSEIVALPKFSHPGYRLIEELVKKSKNNSATIKFLTSVLSLFTFSKNETFTQSDLSILELQLIMTLFSKNI